MPSLSYSGEHHEALIPATYTLLVIKLRREERRRREGTYASVITSEGGMKEGVADGGAVEGLWREIKGREEKAGGLEMKENLAEGGCKWRLVEKMDRKVDKS